MAYVKGLQCSKNNFWKLVHNPIYCGIISIPANKTEDKQFTKGVHEPLISESLFQQVQLIIKKIATKEQRKMN